MSGQRWCRGCLTAYQRERRARDRAALKPDSAAREDRITVDDSDCDRAGTGGVIQAEDYRSAKRPGAPVMRDDVMQERIMSQLADTRYQSAHERLDAAMQRANPGRTQVQQVINRSNCPPVPLIA
jgi:hypothetical protein